MNAAPAGPPDKPLRIADAEAVVASTLARALAPRKALTVSQWADEHYIVSTKGGSLPGRWRTANNPPLREPMDCMSARDPVRELALMFPIQFGKALALDTPIPTPDGWTTMGDIAVGDQVFAADGSLCRVTVCSPVYTDHDCYRITFSDGTEIVSDAGHRWSVIDMAAKNEARHELQRRKAVTRPYSHRKAICDEIESHRVVLDTRDLAEQCAGQKQSRFAVPVINSLSLPPRNLPIDPYILGLWLGDGHSHDALITTMDREVINAFTNYEVKPIASQNAGKATTYRIAGLSAQLRRLNLLSNKHIPIEYLRASQSQRLSLLQGLMDTDGHCGGHAEITSSKPVLAASIIELLRSLGFKPTYRWRATTGHDSCRITFAAFKGSAIFRLTRKLNTLPATPSTRGADMIALRYIRSVERAPTVPTKCIAVDSADHLFLCSESFIATHNTMVALVSVGYTMEHAPGPIMVALPGEVSMLKWIEQKLNPMLEEVDAVRSLLSSTKSRDGANRREFKDFAGGQLYLEHAGSPSRLKSTTVRVLVVDELDELAANLRSGDDPDKMLDGRTSAYPSTHKRLKISTPGIQGFSRIKEQFDRGDQRYYHVPCPHCEHMQPLSWSGLHWGPHGSDVHYVCQECGARIDEHHKTDMIARGEWVPHNPEATTRSYTINGLYYQFGLGPRWATLVEEWLEAQNDPAKLKTFINDRLAETWEDPAMRAVRHNTLADRAEAYPLRLAPAGVLAVTAGLDTQDDREAVQIIGWGEGMQWWVLDYIELPGDPATQALWDSVAELLLRPIEHASGAMLHVEACCIDAGGHRTEHVKAFALTSPIPRTMAIFGAVPNNAPILGKAKYQELKGHNKLDRKGAMIRHVGTVAAKHWLYSRLSTDAELPAEDRRCHISDELDESYFRGIVGETYDPRKTRFIARRGSRVEPLDTWVYAYAATHHPELRLQRLKNADWAARAARIAAQAQRPAAPARLAAPPLPQRPAAGAQLPRGIGGSDWSSRL